MAEIKNEREQLKVLENLFHEKRFSDTLELARKLSRDFPNSFQIRFLHARTLKALNRPEEAAEELKQLMTIFPNNINLLMELADISSNLKQYDEAADQYNKILFLDPFNTQAKEALEKTNILQQGPVDFVSYESRGISNADTLHEFDPTSLGEPPPEQPPESPEPMEPLPPLEQQSPLIPSVIPDAPVSLNFDQVEELPPPVSEPPVSEPPLPEPPVFEAPPVPPAPPEVETTPPVESAPGDLPQVDITGPPDVPELPDIPDIPDFHDFAEIPGGAEIPESQGPPPPAPEPFSDLPGVASVEEEFVAEQPPEDVPIGVTYELPEDPPSNSTPFGEPPSPAPAVPVFPAEIQADEASTVDARSYETPSIDVREPAFPEPEVDLDFGSPSPAPAPSPTPAMEPVSPPPVDESLDMLEGHGFPEDESAELLGAPLDTGQAPQEFPQEFPQDELSDEELAAAPPVEAPPPPEPVFEQEPGPAFDDNMFPEAPEADLIPGPTYDEIPVQPAAEEPTPLEPVMLKPETPEPGFPEPGIHEPEIHEPEIHESRIDASALPEGQIFESEIPGDEVPGAEIPEPFMTEPVMPEQPSFEPPSQVPADSFPEPGFQPQAEFLQEEPVETLPVEPQDAQPAETNEGGPGFITESAAELYVNQGLLEDALSIYRQLYQSQNEERYALKINNLTAHLIYRKQVEVLNRFLAVIQKKGE